MVLADTLDARADSPVRMVGIGANAAEAYANNPNLLEIVKAAQ